MSAVEAPPSDLAPRVLSNDPGDHGTPHGREEEWRFTPVAKLGDFFVAGQRGSVTASESEFVTMTPAETESSTVEKAAHWVASDLPSALARTNATSVVSVAIPAERELDDIVVVDLAGSEGLNYGRIEISAGAFSKATVVLRLDMTADMSGIVVTDVADQADLTVLALYDGPRTSRHMWQWATTVGRDASFLGLAIALGGAIIRLQQNVRYAGPGGSAELLGAFLASDEQFQEFRIFVDHDQPHCVSNVVFKGALSGAQAHTVWIGDVLVRREAVGIETYELNRNLLLNDGPRADSVPNLELETGDVVSAGHASATGRFDDEQLFYLQSRGITEELARQLVVRGFFVEVLDKVTDADLRRDVIRRIEERIGMDAIEQQLAEVDA